MFIETLCPRCKSIVSACTNLKLPVPTRPAPIYTYIPLVSPIKKNDKDGYNMGDDNCLKSTDIKDGALRIVVSVKIFAFFRIQWITLKFCGITLCILTYTSFEPFFEDECCFTAWAFPWKSLYCFHGS